MNGTFDRSASSTAAGRCRRPGRPAALDAIPSGVLLDINRSLDHLDGSPFLREPFLDFEVSGVRDGVALVTFAMPAQITGSFVSLLDSLHGFFRLVERKSRFAVLECKAHDPADQERVEQLREEFRLEVCRLFDDFMGQGLSVKQGVSRTNLALKDLGHPWASHDAVQAALRASGRFRKGGAAGGS